MMPVPSGGRAGERKLEAGILGPCRRGFRYHFAGALLGCDLLLLLFFSGPCSLFLCPQSRFKGTNP